ncbi:MAG: 3'-5' exonuclease [Oligoflexus sp.]
MDYGLIVDLETTGIDPQKDEIIEIGLIEFGVEEGRKPSITNMYSALAQASKPLSVEVQKITGLDDRILSGQSIDWQLVSQYFDRASLYIAHNANFDRAFLEKVFSPDSWSGQWACSMRHVDWEAHGFRTRSLNYLAADHGFVNSFAHRALFDCATTFRLIEPYFDELVKRCMMKEMRLLAVQAPFEAKDMLKSRFYRWDPEKRVWYKDVFEDKLEDERSFLETEIYHGRSRHEELPIN